MRLLRKSILIILLFLGIHAHIYAQYGGYSTYKFLNLPPSARITALGGNLISVKDYDVSNAYQNPALLNKEMSNTYTLNVANYFADMQYGYVATAHHFKHIGTFSAGIQYIDYGRFDMTNEYGDVLSTFDAGERTIHVSYGNAFQNFSYGAALKTVFSNLESYKSSAIMTDWGGTFYDSINGFSASFVLKNVGFQLKKFSDEDENLPFEAQFGLAKKLNHAPFRFTLILHNLQQFDLTYRDPSNQEQQIDLSTGNPVEKKFSFTDKVARHMILGAEILFSQNFNMRFGYDHRKRKELALSSRGSTVGFSWGFGIRVKKINFSYGSARYHLAGSTNMFSLSLNPNDFFKKSIN